MLCELPLKRKVGLRGFLFGILLASYALAQLAGVLHAATHLGHERATPHAVTCVTCIAAVESGSAPVAALPPAPVALARHVMAASPRLLQRSDICGHDYRSRGPPAVV